MERLIHNEPVTNDLTADLFHATTTVLGMQRMSFDSFHKTATYKTWKKHAPGCVEFIDTTWPEVKKSKVTRQALMIYLMQIVKDSMVGWGTPITLNSMVNAIWQTDVLFDQAFPNYRESGMAYLILESMKRQKGT